MPWRGPWTLLPFLFVGCGGSQPVANPPTVAGQSIEMPPPPNDPVARLDWALAGPQRTEYRDPFGVVQANRARDDARHPKETLTFFGIRPEMTVVELWPGGGWFTEILAPYLRDQGKLIVTNGDPATLQGGAKGWAVRYDQKLSSAPGIYGEVEVRRIHPPSDLVLGADESADMVLTFRNLHNWITGGFEKTVLKASYNVLKHGGILGIEEHRADPGSDNKTISDTGYVPEALVIGLAQAAGFELGGKSDVNANPKDDHHHEGGVWSLPPNFANGEKDRAKYAAIGESDRMTLKFRKP
jgi:predicted methyltransferase